MSRPILFLMIAALLSAFVHPAPSRRTWVALLLVMVAVGCSRATPEPPSAPIRLGTYEWPGSYWIDVAYKKGWFKEAGLNVERVNVDHTYFQSLDDVANGKLDSMGFTQFDLVRYVAMGYDLVGVVAIDYSEGAEALIARPGFNHLRDLRGKRIALHRGTYLEYLLTIIAERESFDLDSVTLINRSNDQALEDLKAGNVEAVLVWEPYATQAQEAVMGVQLFSTDEFPGLTYSVMTFRRDFIQKRPDDVEAMLKVWQRAVQYIRDHPDESFEIVAELFDQPLSGVKDMMRTVRVLDLADNGRAFSYAAGFESLHGSWRRMNDFQIERQLVGKRVDSPSHLDSRFVRALE